MDQAQQFLRMLSFLNPWRKQRLETYILKTCITAFGGALLVLAAMILLIDYVDVSRTAGPRADLNGLQMFGLLIEKSPTSILVLLPFAFLFGAIFAFVGLNRRSELIAMRAAGVSAWRFILPGAATAFAFGLLTIMVLNPLASMMKDNYDRAIERLDANQPVDPTQTVYLRQGTGKQQMVIRADGQDSQKIGHLNGVTFWIYNLDKKNVPQFSERVDAERAVLTRGQWQLFNATEYALDKTAEKYDTLSLPSNLDPQKAFKKYASTQSVPFWRLPSLIQQNRASGFSTATYELKLYELLATPLMFAAMTMLGAVFSLRLMRLGGMTPLIISGISLGFVIFFVNQLFNSMGKADVIPAFLAGWSPAILAMLGAMTLLVYTEDG